MTTPVSGHPSDLPISKRRLGATRDGVFKYVYDHLIYEVLLRIPAESLLAFKIVNKACYSIIKDPNFAKQHCDYHAAKEQSIGLVSLFPREYSLNNYDITNINKLQKIDENPDGNLSKRQQNEQFPLNTLAERYLKITSCNGLVCFHTEFPLHTWNPITMELLMLPHPGIDDDKEVASGCGFGFDAIHNEYKVIQLYKRFDDSTLGYENLALATDMSWR
ncbi:putative F-box protein At3g16210 [Papaver somniferum]|uniref:putative F-box protein At3g16210 n=1 Tax=Papaver somniferum TaxID=3469 RepID=UPI000E7022FF|nr:putative F-box protein At3g16210 [Papaver somniferum]